jgi:DnaJ like chaperone protein
MKWIGKLTGGLLGLIALGPIGAAVGVVLGHQFDQQGEEPQPAPASAGELASVGELFFRATFRVMGYLAKADGRVSETEIQAARAVMEQLRLNEPQVREAITCFTAGKQPDFDFGAQLAALAEACRRHPDVARVFLEIQVRAALAGNNLDGPVRPLMGRICAALDISPLEFAHVEAVLRIQRGAFHERAARGAAAGPAAGDRALAEAYRVLESTPEAGDEEVLKAYRRQLSRHHPDKLKSNGLPESMMEHAKERTQQIIEAYELIRARRGLS